MISAPGATPEKVGELPPRSYVYDTWARCPGQIDDYYNLQFARYPDDAPWSEFGPAAEAYFDAVENIYRELVRTGPMTLAEPVALRDVHRFGVKTHAQGDPDILITYTTDPDTEQYW
jgi:hypothetical protein